MAKCETCGVDSQHGAPCTNCVRIKNSNTALMRLTAGILILIAGVLIIFAWVNRYEVVGMSKAGAVKTDRITGESTVIQGRTEYPVVKADPTAVVPPGDPPKANTVPPPRPSLPPPQPRAKPNPEATTIPPFEFELSNLDAHPVPQPGRGDQDDYNAWSAKNTLWVEFSITNKSSLEAGSVQVRLTFRTGDKDGPVIHTVEAAAVCPKQPYAIGVGQIPTYLPAGQTKYVKMAVFAPKGFTSYSLAVIKALAKPQ